MKRLNVVATLVAIVALSVGVSAQCTGGDTGGGSCTLTLNGSGPNAAGQVDVNMGTSATYDFADATGDNPLIVLTGQPDCGGFPVPWGGSVDLTAVVVAIDGFGNTVGPLDFFGNTNLNLSFSLPAGYTGVLPAIQGVYSPSAGVLDNTVMIEGNVPNAIVTTYGNANTPGAIVLFDDGSAQHTLTGTTIDFYGVNYSSLYVGSNGQVTFNAGSGDFSTTNGEFFAGFQLSPTTAPNPAACALWGDFNRNTSFGTIDVIENLTTGSTTVAYNNQDWWDGGGSAGSFSTEFNALGPNSVILDTTGALAGSGVDQDPITGLTDGDDTVGTDTDNSGAGTNVGYASAGAGDSFLVNLGPGVPVVEMVTCLDAGANGMWICF